MIESESNSTLPDLLARAREGDDEAREQLFEKCRAYVAILARTHVESWLRTKVDASDLVQQTLLEVHRGFGEFRGQTEAEWLAWVRRILSHNATDFVRHYHGTAKRRVGREVPLRVARPEESYVAGVELSDPGGTPSQLVLKREREIEMAEAVSRLPADYQEVIVLRNLERLPFNEVAVRMGRSRPAVQMLWMRALKKLQEDLQRVP